MVTLVSWCAIGEHYQVSCDNVTCVFLDAYWSPLSKGLATGSSLNPQGHFLTMWMSSHGLSQSPRPGYRLVVFPQMQSCHQLNRMRLPVPMANRRSTPHPLLTLHCPKSIVGISFTIHWIRVHG